MRFFKKAGKKLFKGAKSVFRKVRKPLAIAGLTFFTAGLGTAGFGAFKGGAASSLGGFLGAVGQTTMAGAQGLMGAVGIGQGLSPHLASQTGAQAGSTLFGGNTGAFANQITGMGSTTTLAGGGTMITPETGAAQSRTLNNFFGGISQAAGMSGGEGAGELGQIMAQQQRRALLFSGIQAGAQAYLAHSQHRREDKRSARLNFFGGPARGSGTSELPFEIPRVRQDTGGAEAGEGIGPRVSSVDGTDFINESTDELFDELNRPHVPSFMRGFV